MVGNGADNNVFAETVSRAQGVAEPAKIRARTASRSNRKGEEQEWAELLGSPQWQRPVKSFDRLSAVDVAPTVTESPAYLMRQVTGEELVALEPTCPGSADVPATAQEPLPHDLEISLQPSEVTELAEPEREPEPELEPELEPDERACPEEVAVPPEGSSVPATATATDEVNTVALEAQSLIQLNETNYVELQRQRLRDELVALQQQVEAGRHVMLKAREETEFALIKHEEELAEIAALERRRQALAEDVKADESRQAGLIKTQEETAAVNLQLKIKRAELLALEQHAKDQANEDADLAARIANSRESLAGLEVERDGILAEMSRYRDELAATVDALRSRRAELDALNRETGVRAEDVAAATEARRCHAIAVEQLAGLARQTEAIRLELAYYQEERVRVREDVQSSRTELQSIYNRDRQLLDKLRQEITIIRRTGAKPKAVDARP